MESIKEICEARKTDVKSSIVEAYQFLDMAQRNEVLKDALKQISWNQWRYLEASDTLLDRMLEDDVLVEDLIDEETKHSIFGGETEAIMRNIKTLTIDLERQAVEKAEIPSHKRRSRRYRSPFQKEPPP